MRAVPSRLARRLRKTSGLVVIGELRGAPRHRLALQWPGEGWVRGELGGIARRRVR